MQGLGDTWRPWWRLTNRIAYFGVLLRRAEYRTNTARGPVGRLRASLLRLRTRRYGERLGFSIPINVFGPGLSIAHVGTIVVNPASRVGRNCRLHQGVTLGQTSGGGAPSVGDDVHISPNALLMGDINVGDRASIWSGAVVVSDVPANANAAGVPAKVRDIEVDRRPWSWKIAHGVHRSE